MHTLVVFESMYGNTHAIAAAIGEGLRSHGEVRVLAAGEADAQQIAWADLVVAGGPTHAHGMSRARSRASARGRAGAPGSQLVLDPAAHGPGIREWLDGATAGKGKRAAAFDTRADAPTFFTGRASAGIAKRLRRHGFALVDQPESFLIDRQDRLVAGEVERARGWGSHLAEVFG
jgi:hypothetical protein